MRAIQVDTFAVGLGASILVQVALPTGESVTILADGGVGSSHSPDEVHKKLDEAFKAFRGTNGPRRIDLIVGTHYDGDHLKGLLPIVSDKNIEIGEVWLPPVMNEGEEIHDSPDVARDLAAQFFDDDSGATTGAYLAQQASQLEELANVERDALNRLSDAAQSRDEGIRATPHRNMDKPRPDVWRSLVGEARSAVVDEYRRYFERHEQDAAVRTGGAGEHDSAIYNSEYKDARDLSDSYRYSWKRSPNELLDQLFRENGYERCRLLPSALASIRKSGASNAITACHLDDLVCALRNRSVKIRPVSHYVSGHDARRFGWVPRLKRFVLGPRGAGAPLTLTLLGPSEGLVKEHWRKLPVASFMAGLVHTPAPIPRESITASNRLSYIFVLEAVQQRVLISGDAGCYGFRRMASLMDGCWSHWLRFTSSRSRITAAATTTSTMRCSSRGLPTRRLGHSLCCRTARMTRSARQMPSGRSLSGSVEPMPT